MINNQNNMMLFFLMFFRDKRGILKAVCT